MPNLLKKPRRNPKTGRVETYYQIQHPGRATLTLGYVTREEADEALILFRAALIREARDESAPPASRRSTPADSRPVAEAPAQEPAPTIRAWWGDTSDPWPAWPDCEMKTWLDARAVRGKALRNWDESRRRIVRELGDLRLDEVTRPVVDAFIARLRADGYSDRTVQIRVGHVMGGLKAAVEYSRLADVPRVPRPRLLVTKERVWATPDQAVDLVAALRRRRADGRLSATSYTAILVGLALGLRSGEIRTRRWEDLDLRAASLTICPVTLPDGTTWLPKANHARTVQVPSTLLTVLTEAWIALGRPSGWMFPSPRKAGWPTGSFRNSLAGACREAGLPHVLHPHALRHTAATALAWQGASLRDLMDHCGWSTEAMAKVYLHSNRARLAELVTAADPLAPTRTSTPEQGQAAPDLTTVLPDTRQSPRSRPVLVLASSKNTARKAG